ncbi:MAG: radical SAM protein [Tissierellia bacterium]|nr:radical SAM protein [Tissierellia bacterium]
MKESFYNINFAYKGKYFIYNTYSNSLIELDKKLDIKDPKFSKVLIENKFLVSDLREEKKDLYNEIIKEQKNDFTKFEITIMLTNRCNFNCTYCYQQHDTMILKRDNTIELLKYIEEVFSSNVKNIWIHYFGGEPLINKKEILYIDREVRKLSDKYNKEYRSYITTNGSLLDEILLKQIKFTRIQFTFDGDKYSHNNFKVSKNFNYFDLVNKIGKVLTLTESTVIVRLNICVENKDDFFNVIDDISNLEYFDKKRILFKINPLRSNFKEENYTELSSEEFAEIYWELTKYLQRLRYKIIFPTKLSGQCGFVTNKAICFGPDLKTRFCSTDLSYEETMDFNKYYNKEYKFEIPKMCENCKVLPLCLDSCKLLSGSPRNCSVYKYKLIDMLKNYIDNPDNWKIL